MKTETRTHLGPGEIEIDSPIYGILLVGNGIAVMAAKVYDSKERAIKGLSRFDTAEAYVVRIGSTNLDTE